MAKRFAHDCMPAEACKLRVLTHRPGLGAPRRQDIQHMVGRRWAGRALCRLPLEAAQPKTRAVPARPTSRVELLWQVLRCPRPLLCGPGHAAKGLVGGPGAQVKRQPWLDVAAQRFQSLGQQGAKSAGWG